MKNYSVIWIKISFIYFLIGVSFGMYMHLTVQLQWKATHAHILVVGWIAASVIGIIHTIFKEIANNQLARLSFWFYQIGLPLLLIGMFSVYYEPMRPYRRIFIEGGGTIFIIGVILIIVNIYTNIKTTRDAT